MLRCRTVSMIVAVLALAAFAGSAQAAKGVKKTGEQQHKGVVTSVTHTATGGTFTIRTHGHKKGTQVGANQATAKQAAPNQAAAHTKTFHFTTKTQFHSVQNKQMNNATAKTLKKGAHVTVTAKADQADHVAIQNSSKTKAVAAKK